MQVTVNELRLPTDSTEPIHLQSQPGKPTLEASCSYHEKKEVCDTPLVLSSYQLTLQSAWVCEDCGWVLATHLKDEWSSKRFMEIVLHRGGQWSQLKYASRQIQVNHPQTPYTSIYNFCLPRKAMNNFFSSFFSFSSSPLAFFKASA